MNESESTREIQNQDLDAKVQLAMQGNMDALAEVFAHFEPRLRRMIDLRIHPRLRRRVDANDVLQEAFLDLRRQLTDFAAKRNLPVHLWLRLVVSQRLAKTHREHLETKKRDAKVEVSIDARSHQASSQALALRLVSNLTPASKKLQRAELQVQVQSALDKLSTIDREILTLRNYEELSNKEAAIELSLTESAATQRYVRALTRLGEELGSLSASGVVSLS